MPDPPVGPVDAGETTLDPGTWDPPPQVPGATYDARLLVLSSDGSEGALGAIRRALDFQQTPYTVWIARDRPGALTGDALFDGTHGFYQGVILVDAEVAEALADAESSALRDYEIEFGLREAVLFRRPDQGSTVVWDTSAAPLTGTLTEAGRAVFPYLAGPITIDDGDAYLAGTSADRTTPLLTDDQGHALITVETDADGRQTLALAFEGDADDLHTIALSYGVINWVTRGLFVGERRVFAGPQVDDVFLGNKLYSGGVYRIDGDDLAAVAAWQREVQARPTTAGFVLTMAFNGRGATGMYDPDTLTPAAQALQREFWWLSHTYTHEDLDDADYATTAEEIVKNDQFAAQFGFAVYDPVNIVTPAHSGLANPEAMHAVLDQGIAFMISNTSRPEENNPAPNVGRRNALQPEVLQLPRHPTAIYYDVTTPEEEVIAYADRHSTALDYDEIIDSQSDRLLGYMMVGDIDPWMFHQSNLRAYDGTSTLLTDVVGRAFAKYEAIFNLPVTTLPMEQLGAEVALRTALHDSGAAATITPAESITLTVERDATVPVTGIDVPGAVTYGGQSIARVRVEAGSPVTISLP